jgi:hypothetical protein
MPACPAKLSASSSFAYFLRMATFRLLVVPAAKPSATSARVAVCKTPQCGFHIAFQHADLLLLTGYEVCDW